MKSENTFSSFGCTSTPRDKRNQWRINLWMLAWMAAWLPLMFAFKEGYIPEGPLTFTAILATVPLGIAVVFSYRKFLREADELRRKIELDALALSVGVTLVGSFTFWLLEAAGVVPEVKLDHIVLLISLTYVFGVFIGFRRYR